MSSSPNGSCTGTTGSTSITSYCIEPHVEDLFLQKGKKEKAQGGARAGMKRFFTKYFMQGQQYSGEVCSDDDEEEEPGSKWVEQFLERNRKYIGFLLPCLFMHLIWWTLAFRYNLFRLFPSHYELPLTMVLGATVAGMTSEGGGAVAFPVMTLLLQINPIVARDFSLMIQSCGMTSAAFTILWMRIKLALHHPLHARLHGRHHFRPGMGRLSADWPREEDALRQHLVFLRHFPVCAELAAQKAHLLLHRALQRVEGPGALCHGIRWWSLQCLFRLRCRHLLLLHADPALPGQREGGHPHIGRPDGCEHLHRLLLAPSDHVRGVPAGLELFRLFSPCGRRLRPFRLFPRLPLPPTRAGLLRLRAGGDRPPRLPRHSSPALPRPHRLHHRPGQFSLLPRNQPTWEGTSRGWRQAEEEEHCQRGAEWQAAVDKGIGWKRSGNCLLIVPAPLILPCGLHSPSLPVPLDCPNLFNFPTILCLIPSPSPPLVFFPTFLSPTPAEYQALFILEG